MQTLRTSRLLLFPTPKHIVEKRLNHSLFTDTVHVDGNDLTVHFPEEWPGDALVIFPMLLDDIKKNPQLDNWGGVVVETATNTAVGQMGFSILFLKVV